MKSGSLSCNLVFGGFSPQITIKTSQKPSKLPKVLDPKNLSLFPWKQFQNQGRKMANWLKLETGNLVYAAMSPLLNCSKIYIKFSLFRLVLWFSGFTVSKTGKPEKPRKNVKQICHLTDAALQVSKEEQM